MDQTAKAIDGNEAIEILRWLIFDDTEITDENDRVQLGSMLTFIATEAKPYYEKYKKQETNNVNSDQTGDQPE